jgi:hypothetical protein
MPAEFRILLVAAGYKSLNRLCLPTSVQARPARLAGYSHGQAFTNIYGHILGNIISIIEVAHAAGS